MKLQSQHSDTRWNKKLRKTLEQLFDCEVRHFVLFCTIEIVSFCAEMDQNQTMVVIIIWYIVDKFAQYLAINNIIL